MSRKIDNTTYLTYLLKYLNVNDLKQVCRDFDLKGFSRLKKDDLIEFILNSLAEEEMIELLQQRELDIVSDGIKVGLPAPLATTVSFNHNFHAFGFFS